MIKSMTGFGCAEGQLNGITSAVEIKTVNNRYFKVRIKLPDAVAFLEEDIEKLLRQNLSRGMATYVLRLKSISETGPYVSADAEENDTGAPSSSDELQEEPLPNALFDIDQRALQRVIGQLNRTASAVDIKCQIDLAYLLSLPGIMVPVSPDKEKADQIRKKVLSITQEAIDQLKQMRAAEGAALAADLEGNCKAIVQGLEQIRARRGTVLQEYNRKLKKRVDELLADAKLALDEETLAREAAVFAERSDISEEIARLDSHLQQFTQTCQTDEQAGRRLDFISQEMLREANTIASKACDTEIARCVVDMKCRIDRIKEQVQNIE